MKVQLYTLVFFVGISFHSVAQQNHQSVVATAGDISKSGNLVLEWTVGEAFVERVF